MRTWSSILTSRINLPEQIQIKAFWDLKVHSTQQKRIITPMCKSKKKDRNFFLIPTRWVLYIWQMSMWRIRRQGLRSVQEIGDFIQKMKMEKTNTKVPQRIISNHQQKTRKSLFQFIKSSLCWLWIVKKVKKVGILSKVTKILETIPLSQTINKKQLNPKMNHPLISHWSRQLHHSYFPIQAKVATKDRIYRN